MELAAPGSADGMSRFGVIERGYYADRLARCLDLFGDDLCVLVFERDVVAGPEQGLAKVCRHVGVDPARGRFTFRDNRKERKPSLTAIRIGYHLPFLRPLVRKLDRGAPFRIVLTPAERVELIERYLPDIERTERILGHELPEWKR
jgi:hypothetical protein